MTMGTNAQQQKPSRPGTRSAGRTALMNGISAVVFGLLFVMQLPGGSSWLAFVAMCTLGIAAFWNVGKTIITLR